MSVKISELPILDSLADNDVIAGVDTSANVTSKIEMATLKNYIDTNTQYTAGKNINITNNVISAPFVYDKTQTNALLDDFKDETNASIEDLKDETDTQIKELQSEVDSLSTIFNAFPTESGEGESLTLDDTAEVKFKKFDLKGNTSQTTYSGKNLFNIEGSYETGTGITYTKNSDGSYTLNGTANGNNFLRGLCYLNKQHTISYTSNVSNSNVIIRTRTGTPTAQTGIQDQLAVSSTSGNLTSSKQFDFVEISIVNGTTLNNFKIYIQLEKGSSVTSFEPYVGGTASPNPSYPQPVNVVSGDNEIEVCGKNLFDKNNLQGHFFYNSDTYLPNSTINAWDCSNFIKVENNTQYTISLEKLSTTSAYGQIIEWDKNKNGINQLWNIIENKTITTTGTTVYITIAYKNTVYTNPQVEKSNQATTYEPYQGNTYNIDLPVENLLPDTSTTQTINGVTFTRNDNGTITINGTASYNADYYIYGQSTDTGSYLSFKKGKYSILTSQYKNGVLFIAREKTAGAKVESSTTSQVTTLMNTQDCYFYGLLIRVEQGTSCNNIIIEPQLEKGSKINSYTPYGTTPIELCKIGNYQDYFYKDSGKWYLHKKIGEKNFTSTNTNMFGIGTDTNYTALYISKSSIGTTSGIWSPGVLLCSHFGEITDASNIAVGKFRTNGNGDNADFYLPTSVTTLAEAKTYMDSLTNSKIYYRLATPTTTEITYQPLIDQLNLLEKAMSKDSQTNISQVNNDLGFIIYAEAIKSLQNVLDRIELLES